MGGYQISLRLLQALIYPLSLPRRLIEQRIADLSNIFAQIVDFACNLIRILDCHFIVEILVDPNLDKTIGSADFASNLGGSTNLYIPIHPPPPPIIYVGKIVFVGKILPSAPPKTWDPGHPC